MTERHEVNGIIVPGPDTLARYGMAIDDWLCLGAISGWVCGCCGKKPDSGRLFIDHEHVRGWKRLAPEERRRYVRGLACYVCNRFILNHRVSVLLLRQGADYLERYSLRPPLVEGKVS